MQAADEYGRPFVSKFDSCIAFNELFDEFNKPTFEMKSFSEVHCCIRKCRLSSPGLKWLHHLIKYS